MRSNLPAKNVYIFLDEQPPADVVAAATRGECWLIVGNRPRDVERWGRALAQYADAKMEENARQVEARAEEIIAVGGKG
jgi:hypothetical protein